MLAQWLVGVHLVLAPCALGEPEIGAPTPPPSTRTDGFAALPAPELHLETPNDEPAGGPRATLGGPVRPRTIVVRGPHVSIQVNVDADGNNIVGDAANEPSIAVDPNDPEVMVVGWRQFDSITSDFRQAGWAYTHDGGATWTFPGVLEDEVFRSDPVLQADADGNIYYLSLTDDFTCQLFKSVDGGKTWLPPVEAFGGDKEWFTIDRTDGASRGNIYSFWSSGSGPCEGQFTRSYDGGQTFLDCIDVPGDPYWGTMDVGPDGELYIVGDNTIVAKSSTIKYPPPAPPAFDFSTYVELDGISTGYGDPNPGGLLGQGYVAVDHSDGPFHGNVYVLSSVYRFSIYDPADVMFARSEDGGLTWSAPVRVNDDPEGNGAYQWFGMMSVAPNGRIDVVWNDTRNSLTYGTELYYAYSYDAGETWSVNEPVSPSFNPHLGWPQQNKIGDYYDMASDAFGCSVIYSATFNGEQDVYYLRPFPDDCNGNSIPDAEELAADHDCCTFKHGVGCSDPDIQSCICAIDPYCCNVDWDRLCVDLVTRESCGICPAGDCNDNAIPDECEYDCNGNNIADACEILADHDCCEPRQGPGCSDAAIQACVCAIDPYCCDVVWDERCAGYVSSEHCGVCPTPDCNANAQPDQCEIDRQDVQDCNADAVPDECALVQRPADLLVCPLASAVFTVERAEPGLDLQWLRNGVPLVDGGRISGATTDTLTITGVKPSDAGDLFTCQVFDGCLLLETDPVVLDVITLGQITQQPAEVKYACAGESTVLAIQYAGGSTSPSFQWYADGEPLVNGPKYGNVKTKSLQINDVAREDEGIAYTCVVSNACESVESDPGSILVVTPQFTVEPADDCGELGETVELSVEATAPLTVYYQWRKEAATVGTGNTLTLANLEPDDAGEYRALAFTLSPTCVATSAAVVVQVGGCPTCAAPGDLDNDGDVDLADLHSFMLCFHANVLDRPDCACANVNEVDWQVDESDWTATSLLVAGPQ